MADQQLGIRKAANKRGGHPMPYGKGLAIFGHGPVIMGNPYFVSTVGGAILQWDNYTVLRAIKAFLAEPYEAAAENKKFAESWPASNEKWNPNGEIKK